MDHLSESSKKEILDFLQSGTGRSVIDRYAGEVFTLLDVGCTQVRILEFLATKGVSIRPLALSKWIKKHTQNREQIFAVLRLKASLEAKSRTGENPQTPATVADRPRTPQAPTAALQPAVQTAPHPEPDVSPDRATRTIALREDAGGAVLSMHRGGTPVLPPDSILYTRPTKPRSTLSVRGVPEHLYRSKGPEVQPPEGETWLPAGQAWYHGKRIYWHTEPKIEGYQWAAGYLLMERFNPAHKDPNESPEVDKLRHYLSSSKEMVTISFEES